MSQPALTEHPLALREPALEWATRSGSGELEDLGWVAAEVSPELRPLRQFDDESGRRRFRHYPYTLFLPPAVAQAAEQLQRAGHPTAWEGLVLLFARTEWTMASRDYLWTPSSPAPALLGSLVEAFGIEAALHRRDPDTLRRLTALLPSWHPTRGTVARARDVLESCELQHELESVTTLDESGRIPRSPKLDDEVFTCHVALWWQLRRQDRSAPEYRITDGYLRFQPADDAAKWVLRKEDVLLTWRPGGDVPKAALRLLPSWSVVRLVVGARKSSQTSKTPKAKKTS